MVMEKENRNYTDPENRDSVEEIPSLIKIISSNEVEGFDSVRGNSRFDNQSQQTEAESPSSSAMLIKSADAQSQRKESHIINHQKIQSVSISLPSSPTMETELKKPKGVVFNVNDKEMSTGNSDSTESGHQKYEKFFSQPTSKGCVLDGAVETAETSTQHPSIARFKDRRFDSFKTWSGKLTRQLTNLRGKPREDAPEEKAKKSDRNQINLPVDRYFDALEGPELDTLRASEEIVLPDDKTWPFLLRYPVSSFGICLGVSSQAILWKTLATSESTKFLHISTDVNLVLWFISVTLVAIISSIYLMKTLLYFEAVRREYYHPIRVNFFFAPWIALLFLALGVPPSVTKTLPEALWYILMTPIFCIALKLYGQWMSGGQRKLSKVANPSNHLSIVGNFVGALLGASMGLKEGPIFFFAVGLAHYTVLFVTLYQRLPTNETLPKELHPVFFLFVAAPSVASMAWAKIQGSFDYGSRIAYFIAMFLYFSLAVRINFFRGFKFSLAWWAYTFPMTGAAIATIRYSNEVTNVVTRGLVIILSAVATLTVTALLVTTILHAFVLRDLFPNDIAIAISDKRPKHQHHPRKWFHLRHGSSEHNDIEDFLKFACPDSKDAEAGVDPPSIDSKVV